MIKPIVISACLTGLFCAGFAVVIDWATDMLQRNQVLIVSFISGFLGSVFAQTILKTFKKNQ